MKTHSSLSLYVNHLNIYSKRTSNDGQNQHQVFHPELHSLIPQRRHLTLVISGRSRRLRRSCIFFLLGPTCEKLIATIEEQAPACQRCKHKLQQPL